MFFRKVQILPLFYKSLLIIKDLLKDYSKFPLDRDKV